MQEIYVPPAYEIVSWGGLGVTVNRFYSARTATRSIRRVFARSPGRFPRVVLIDKSTFRAWLNRSHE